MEEMFRRGMEVVAHFVEGAAGIVIAYGAAEAFYELIRGGMGRRFRSGELRRSIWRRFAIWLVLGLEFAFAADIVRTAISPTWDAIGQLAAIAVIRTFLSYFLEKDIDKAGEMASEKAEI